MNLKTWIKKERGRNGRLARAAGVSCPTISKIASGVQAATLEVALKIEKATDGQVTVRDLARIPRVERSAA